MTTRQLLAHAERLGQIHYPAPPERTPNGLCDCGRTATRRIGSGWQCEKCERLQALYANSFHSYTPRYVGEEMEQEFRERRSQRQKLSRWRRKQREQL